MIYSYKMSVNMRSYKEDQENNKKQEKVKTILSKINCFINENIMLVSVVSTSVVLISVGLTGGIILLSGTKDQEISSIVLSEVKNHNLETEEEISCDETAVSSRSSSSIEPYTPESIEYNNKSKESFDDRLSEANNSNLRLSSLEINKNSSEKSIMKPKISKDTTASPTKTELSPNKKNIIESKTRVVYYLEGGRLKLKLEENNKSDCKVNSICFNRLLSNCIKHPVSKKINFSSRKY